MSHLSLKEMSDLMEGGADFSQEELSNTVRYFLMHLTPYMIAVDAMVKDTQYGTLDVTFHIRDSEVVKMEFHQAKTWLRDKDI